MKNASTMALSLFAVTLALSSVPIRAEVVSNADQTVALNSPDIKVVGKGVRRSSMFGKIGEANFVLRSSPIESDAEVYLFRDNQSYDVLTCRTPCLFKIPYLTTFQYKVKEPSGYYQVSKVEPIRWKDKNLTTIVVTPDDITFIFVPQ
jgi:hypothetical protein